jgi:hypothetical protein
MQISHQQKEFVMNSEKLDIRQAIGIPLSAGHGRSAQIDLFQKFLDAEQAGCAVTFTQTSSGLKLEVYKQAGWRDYDEDERQVRTNLIRRSLIILREKIGYLVATKGCTRYFDFWVECPVIGGLPPHRWTSLGELWNPAKCKRLDAEQFGLATLSAL